MNNRLRAIRKELNMTQETLANRLGIGKSALSMIETGKASLSERNQNILIQELNINPEWLKTGLGKMFNGLPPASMSPMQNEILLHKQSVPLYNIEVAASLASIFSNRSSFSPVDYIYIPNLPHCDGAIRLTGDNMHPLLNSGDIILYKQVNEIENIFWGEMYLLSIDMEGEEYITVKYIQKSEKKNFIKLVSYNPQNTDKDIPTNKIKALAIVKATIRINTIR